jgi:hypothetical protein
MAPAEGKEALNLIGTQLIPCAVFSKKTAEAKVYWTSPMPLMLPARSWQQL